MLCRIVNFNRMFFYFHINTFVMSFVKKTCDNEQVKMARMTLKWDLPGYFRHGGKFFLQKGHAILKSSVLNIQLFKKCDITL